MVEKIIDAETIRVSVTYGENKTVFPLRMVSLAKERELRTSVFNEKTKEDEYSADVDLLAQLIADRPVGLDDGQTADSMTANSDLVRRFFEVRTPMKERIALYAVRTYFFRLQPEEFAR
jgi:hypothetical protein